MDTGRPPPPRRRRSLVRVVGVVYIAALRWTEGDAGSHVARGKAADEAVERAPPNQLANSSTLVLSPAQPSRTTLATLAHAILAAIAAREHTNRPQRTKNLIALTVNEIPYLLAN